MRKVEMKGRCPTCEKRLKYLGVGSMAVGSLIAEADVFECKERHVWASLNRPVIFKGEITPSKGQ